jgi:hypothetical protein
VTETSLEGWDETPSPCSEGIDLSAGEVVTCTFTNTQRARIVVAKETEPGGSPQEFDFTASYTETFSLSDGETKDSGLLVPGTGYTVTETSLSGWDTSSACSDESSPSDIDLTAGEVVTCTFTNTNIRGRIVVAKETEPDGSPQEFDFTASYTGTFSLSDGETKDSGLLVSGTYTVAEDSLATWSTSSACSGGSSIDAIVLSASDVVTCTFTNRQTVLYLPIIFKNE